MERDWWPAALAGDQPPGLRLRPCSEQCPPAGRPRLLGHAALGTGGVWTLGGSSCPRRPRPLPRWPVGMPSPTLRPVLAEPRAVCIPVGPVGCAVSAVWRHPGCGAALQGLGCLLGPEVSPRASCLLRAVFSSVPCLGYLTNFEAGVRLRLPWKRTPGFADFSCWGLCSSPGCILILILGTPPPARNKGSNRWLWAWVWFITTCRVRVVPLGDMTVSVPESVLLGSRGPGETPRGTLSSVSVTVALSFLEHHTGRIPGDTVFCV